MVLLLETNDDRWGSWMNEKPDSVLAVWKHESVKWWFLHWNARTTDKRPSLCSWPCVSHFRQQGVKGLLFIIASRRSGGNCWFKVDTRSRKLTGISNVSALILLSLHDGPVVGKGKTYSLFYNNSLRERQVDWGTRVNAVPHAHTHKVVDTHLVQTNQIRVEQQRKCFLLYDSHRKKSTDKEKVPKAQRTELWWNNLELSAHSETSSKVMSALIIFWFINFFSSVCFCLSYWFPTASFDDSQRMCTVVTSSCELHV